MTAKLQLHSSVTGSTATTLGSGLLAAAAMGGGDSVEGAEASQESSGRREFRAGAGAGAGAASEWAPGAGQWQAEDGQWQSAGGGGGDEDEEWVGALGQMPIRKLQLSHCCF
eukprot:COSAG04_NODE_5834_length_1479_cov_2.474638_2_plen_112_part_00